MHLATYCQVITVVSNWIAAVVLVLKPKDR